MDFGEMMRNVQNVAGRFKEQQEDLRKKSAEGTSGGGMVKARMNGAGELTGLEIEREVIDPDDPEMLSDLIVAAVEDARKKVESLRMEGLRDLTGGLDLSGLGIDPSTLM